MANPNSSSKGGKNATGINLLDPLNFSPVSSASEDNVFQATSARDLLGPLASQTAPPPETAEGSESQPSDASAPATYRWERLTDSSLKGRRNKPMWDMVTQYKPGDLIDPPDSITTTEIYTASGNINKLNAGQINAKGVKGTAFLPHTAAAFTYNGPIEAYRNGVFLVFNDHRPGYQHKTDSLIFLQGFSFGSSPAEGELQQTANTIAFWQPTPIPPADTLV